MPGPLDLEGHAAVVTGGNSGIGLGIARALASAGAGVAIWGTNESRNDAAVLELERLGGRAFALRCDARDELQVGEAVTASVERLGGLDSCFANAGAASPHPPFVELTLDEWRAVEESNLTSSFLTLRAAARCMVCLGAGGSLVATSSLAAVEGIARSQPYSAAKAGVVAMIRSIAVELAPHGIRANAILPGVILTPMSEARLSRPSAEAKLLPRIPMRRWGTPDDFAGIALYLASPLSSYHTGDTFTIDGGFAIA